MLIANGHKNYTASGDVRAEELISRVLSEIGETLSTSGLSVYLGGSYGRGEGGVRQDPENGVLYNDLDFFVFSRRRVPGAEKLLHEIAEKYEAQLKVDVDFSTPASVSSIKRNRKRLMMQELKRGYRLVCGEDLLAEYLPELHAEKLPFSEACRLLLNRGMGLRFAGEKLAEEPLDLDFILRNICKALLGAGDAGLIAKGCYRWRIAERLEEIRNSDLPGRWKQLYADAAAFKRSPHRNVPEDLPALLEEARAFFLASVLGAAGAESLEELPQKMREKFRSSGELSFLNCVKYCVKTRKIPRNICFLMMPPAAVVLCNLCCGNTDGSELYKQWLKFN